MDFSITQTELTKALGQLQSIVERKSTMPILANCLMEAMEKFVRFTATDLEVAMTLDVPAEVKQPGRVTVGARSLFEIVKSLGTDKVRVTTAANHWVEVTAGKARFKIVGLAADEYPQVPAPTTVDAQKMESAIFLQMLAKTSYAMSTDETRYNLNGLLMEYAPGEGKQPGHLRMVATDGHRLALIERPVKTPWNVTKGVIVPRKGINEWRKLVDAGTATDFLLQIDEKYLTVQSDRTTLMIRLIDGQFPPYRQVIPTEHKWVLMAPREALLATLKRVQLVTTEKARGVKFKLSPGHLDILANSPEIGEAHEELQVQYKGETLEIGFNARYVADVLSVLPDEQMTMTLKGEMGPCLLKSEKDPHFLAVVMPMRLS